MSNNNYEVGQILFLTKPNKFSIVPAQIIEEITRRNLDGVQTIHNIKIPGVEKTLELNNFDGEIFKDISEVKIYLIEHAQKSIENLVSSCLETAKQTFNYSHLDKNDTLPPPELIDDAGVVEIDLGDGQIGKVKMTDDYAIDTKKKPPAPKRKRGRPRKKEASE